MKKIISILLFACAGALAACDFLDVVPEGQATQEDIFKTSKEARKYLNTLYTYAPNIAAYRYMPDFCAGDDIITATNGQTRYFPYKSTPARPTTVCGTRRPLPRPGARTTTCTRASATVTL